MNFTFTKEPGMVVLDYLSSVVQVGVDMYIYYSDRHNRIFKYEYKNQQKNLIEITEDSMLSQIYDIRKPRKKIYSWELGQEFINSNPELKNKPFQFNINDELEHFVLSMRFVSQYDQNHDVVFVKFRKDMSFIGLDGSDIILNTENKKIVANILYRTTIAFLNFSRNDFSAFRDFTEMTELTISNAKDYKDELIQLKDKHQKTILSIINKVIDEYSHKYMVSFELTEECKDMFKDYSGDISRLETITRKIVDYAYSINIHRQTSVIAIEKEYFKFLNIDLDPERSIIQGEKQIRKESREDLLLIKLEEIEKAVVKLIANKEKIIGTNVAKMFQPPKTAASITDYLKKYSNQINIVLNDNPNLFPESRKHFTPLKNIIKSKAKAS